MAIESLTTETREINTSNETSKKINIKLLIIVIFVFIIVVSIGIVLIYVLGRNAGSVQQSGNTNKPSFSDIKAKFASPTPITQYSYSIEPNQAMKGAGLDDPVFIKEGYKVKRIDIKTGKTEVIYKIPVSSLVGVQTGFGKEEIKPFVFSQDQKLMAYNTTETVVDSKSQPPTAKDYHAVHIFNTSTIKDTVIYREPVDLSKLFTLGNEQSKLDCENQTTESVVEECFDILEAFHLYDKAPILFSKDNKKLILIGASGFLPESANQGVFVLNADGYQNTYRILSKNQISKHPLLSPSGKYLLVAITISDFETAPDNTTINQVYTEVSITLYDMTTEKISYQKLVNAQSKNNTDQFHVWDPYFLTDQLIVIPTEKQLLILDTQTDLVKETTNEELKTFVK